LIYSDFYTTFSLSWNVVKGHLNCFKLTINKAILPLNYL